MSACPARSMMTNSESVILKANQSIFEVDTDEGHCAPIRMRIPKPSQAAAPVGNGRIQLSRRRNRVDLNSGDHIERNSLESVRENDHL